MKNSFIFVTYQLGHGCTVVSLQWMDQLLGRSKIARIDYCEPSKLMMLHKLKERDGSWNFFLLSSSLSDYNSLTK